MNGTPAFTIGVTLSGALGGGAFGALVPEAGRVGKTAGELLVGEITKPLGRLQEGMHRIGEAMAEDLSDSMQVFQEAGLSAVYHLRSAFQDFVRTGELDFRALVAAMAESLAMIAFDQFIGDPLRNFFSNLVSTATSSAASASGSGGGGFFSTLISSGLSALTSILGMRALGGPVSFGRPYVVGERGRELFVPNTSGRIVPAGGGQQIVFNVNATDAQSFQRSETQIAAMLNRMVRRGQRNL